MNDIVYVYVVETTIGDWEEQRTNISGIFHDAIIADDYVKELNEKNRIIRDAGEPGELTEEMVANMTTEQIDEWSECWDKYYEALEYRGSRVEPIELNKKYV